MSDWLMQSFPNVAAALDYRVRGDRSARARCPNTERHRRGDAAPSLLLKLADNGGLIFNCLPPGQQVQGRFSGGLKSVYSGEVVEITTHGNRSLTVTANHPVLTVNGFIAAKNIAEGDYLVCHIGEKQLGALRENDQHSPSAIEDVFHAIKVLEDRSRLAPVSAFDLDGDERFFKSEVEIVGAYRELLEECEAARFHVDGEPFFAGSDMGLPLESGDSGSLVGRIATLASPRRLVGTGHHGDAVGVTHSAPSNLLLLAKRSDFPSVCLKAGDDAAGIYSKPVGDTLHGVASIVHGEHFAYGDRGCLLGRSSARRGVFGASFCDSGVLRRKSRILRFGAAANLDTFDRKSVENNGTVSPNLPRDLLDGHAGLVCVDRVSKLVRRQYTGHVYDLSTDVGYFAAGSTGGVIVSNCKAGCPKTDVLASMGMKWRDVCHDRPFKPGPPMQIVKAYQYFDPDGAEAYQVVRYHPKTFRPRRRVPGLDGWVYEINGAPVKRVEDRHEEIGFKWVGVDGKKRGDAPAQGERAIPPLEMWPYNANYLQATSDTGKIVVFCEGEKDCDNLMRLGFLATTAQGGASQRIFGRKWAKLFRGRHLVVVPDNDEPGRLFARHYAGCFLDASVASVTMLHLPGQPEKGDMSDWIHRNQQGASDTGPNSQVAKTLKSIIAKQSGYGRKELKAIFGKGK